MGGLPCAKQLIDTAIQNQGSLECLKATADLFQLQLEDEPTEEVMKHLKDAGKATKKALNILQKSLGLESDSY